MKKQNIGRRARRSFALEFKADAVRLVKSGKSPGQVAEVLDLTETLLREWIRRADADAGVESPDVLTTEERQELARLRRENKTLRMEREILKAAAAHSTGHRNTKTSDNGLKKVVRHAGSQARFGCNGESRPLAALEGGTIAQ